MTVYDGTDCTATCLMVAVLVSDGDVSYAERHRNTHNRLQGLMGGSSLPAMRDVKLFTCTLCLFLGSRGARLSC